MSEEVKKENQKKSSKKNICRTDNKTDKNIQSGTRKIEIERE